MWILQHDASGTLNHGSGGIYMNQRSSPRCLSHAGVRISWLTVLLASTLLLPPYQCRSINFTEIFTNELPTQEYIPKIAHFVFATTRPLQWIEFAAIKSSVVTLGVETINLWVPPGAMFDGHIWDVVMGFPEVVVRKVEMPTEVYGNLVEQPAHKSDLVRLEVLYKEGGIYMDYNAIALRSMDDIIYDSNTRSTVMAHSVWGRLGNAWMMAKPHAPFLRYWMSSYTTFDDTKWASHSTDMAGTLSHQHRHDITVLDLHSWYFPECCGNASTDMLWFGKTFTSIDENYGVHQWNAQFISTGLLTKEAVREIDTPFFCRIRHLFDRVDDEYVAMDWRTDANCSVVSVRDFVDQATGLMSSYNFQHDTATKFVDDSGNHLHGWAPYGIGLLRDDNIIVREFELNTFVVLPLPSDYDSRVGTLSTELLFQHSDISNDISITLARIRLPKDEEYIMWQLRHDTVTNSTWLELVYSVWATRQREGMRYAGPGVDFNKYTSNKTLILNDNTYHAFTLTWDRRTTGIITATIDGTAVLHSNASLLKEATIGQELWLNSASQEEIDMNLRARMRYLRFYNTASRHLSGVSSVSTLFGMGSHSDVILILLVSIMLLAGVKICFGFSQRRVSLRHIHSQTGENMVAGGKAVILAMGKLATSLQERTLVLFNKERRSRYRVVPAKPLE